MPVVCLDPGHPSEIGRGTRGKRLTEIRAAWTVALLVRRRLAQDGYTVVMTKASEGRFVRNRDRAAVANRARADLMVRLHCDGGGKRGFAVYYADRQGRAEGRVGPSRETLARTAAIAPVFHRALAAGLRGSLPDNGLLPDARTAVGRTRGALIGSIFSEVPSVLVEMATLTDPRDEAFLLSPSGRTRMADAIAAAVRAAVPPASVRGIGLSRWWSGL